jgi:hypothetical protein
VLLIAVAILLPVSARAVTLITFTNGTVADANQVNANFAALQPISGAAVALLSTIPLNVTPHIDLPAFTAPRTMTCIVSLQGFIFTINPVTPAFGPLFVGSMSVNGAGVLTDPPSSDHDSYFTKGADPTTWQAFQTSRYTIGAGSAAVGADFAVAGTGLDTSGGSLVLKGVYTCY